ncbi:4-hydroxythreonine-4-phosphate dehydrogenase PdxA [Halobacteriales archaeon QS_1_68_17]|nr:MAG: 4-hydroxythreonine-4-phosphate dehydrogenase PdxA [Halobacteriales archaeon QS_1_68_17]
MGDPAGIGSEIIVKAYPQVFDAARPVVLGDFDVMADAVAACESDLDLRRVETVDEARFETGVLDVVDFDNLDEVVRGEHRGEYGRASLDYVEHGIELATSGAIDAMCNAPINKKALEMAGSDYAGHTNLLADRTGTDEYSMLLIQDELRVTHVTVHMSLQEAIDTITTERVLETIEVTDEGLRGLGIEDPSIAVCGLNPHAGEGGVLGTTDAEEIEPAVERARDAGIDASGPWAGDNIFNQAAVGRFDGVVAMYHDQGHIATNVHGLLPSGGFAGVNMTIGLPIVRTSTTHGTAFDIAGTGIADEDSMVDAIRAAARAAEAGMAGTAAD